MQGSQFGAGRPLVYHTLWLGWAHDDFTSCQVPDVPAGRLGLQTTPAWSVPATDTDGSRPRARGRSRRPQNTVFHAQSWASSSASARLEKIAPKVPSRTSVSRTRFGSRRRGHRPPGPAGPRARRSIRQRSGPGRCVLVWPIREACRASCRHVGRAACVRSALATSTTANHF